MSSIQTNHHDCYYSIIPTKNFPILLVIFQPGDLRERVRILGQLEKDTTVLKWFLCSQNSFLPSCCFMYRTASRVLQSWIFKAGEALLHTLSIIWRILYHTPSCTIFLFNEISSVTRNKKNCFLCHYYIYLECWWKSDIKFLAQMFHLQRTTICINQVTISMFLFFGFA